MRNEYGIRLDKNGYAPSIMQEGDCCHLCGRNGSGDKLDRHEVFGGAFRTKSKQYGLWVLLCHERCHLCGVHANASLRVPLQREAQLAAMKYYGWDIDDWISRFERSYL